MGRRIRPALEETMRSRTLIIVAFLTLALAGAPWIMAQDEPTETESLLEWDDSPAGFLMTKNEK